MNRPRRPPVHEQEEVSRRLMAQKRHSLYALVEYPDVFAGVA